MLSLPAIPSETELTAQLNPAVASERSVAGPGNRFIRMATASRSCCRPDPVGGLSGAPRIVVARRSPGTLWVATNEAISCRAGSRLSRKVQIVRRSGLLSALGGLFSSHRRSWPMLRIRQQHQARRNSAGRHRTLPITSQETLSAEASQAAGRVTRRSPGRVEGVAQRPS